jgi:hypothetical protein
MSLAWGIAAPLAVYFAMMNKGNASWFPLHWITAAVVGVLTLIAASLAFAYVSISGSGHLLAAAASPTNGGHGVFGLVIFLVLIVQVVLGIIIDRVWVQGSPTTLFEYIHHWTGRLLLLSAAIEVCLGVFEVRTSLWIIAIPVIWFVIVGGLLIIRALARRQEKSGHGNYSSSSSSSPNYMPLYEYSK